MRLGLIQTHVEFLRYQGEVTSRDKITIFVAIIIVIPLAIALMKRFSNEQKASLMSVELSERI